MRTAPCNLNRNILYLDLVIEKIVIVPSHEFEAWTSWYHEQNRLNNDFVLYFERAISRPRSQRALMNEAVLASKSKPATLSSVEALEEVKLVSSDVPTELCTICQEDSLVGTNVRRMPCSHMFHKECIMKWLKGSHICPLCRFMLPKD
ncbi:unnamed protein product [Ilex paraguariensis]|uniref:RING-type E3 ubiquitin transferase n=1 Tax=Ilex paraguariensis TaxID=185542 RepID=A0ABC8SW59_9AQUA